MTVTLCTSRLQVLPLLHASAACPAKNGRLKLRHKKCHAMKKVLCCAGLHQGEEGEGEAYDQPVT